ncbi:serine/threonine protein kinase [Aphanomyces invadans]|uniref:Serine/threonine protein kinase n=1 Tax=Aphanomyces invadans TaxID=157072 RepID=A0A024TWL8_9STRA|nr:serine/threonine protein kinase [Aphanomyces invadans]ETV98388.1 serine/threonine protein kinase [Aphanomyces invadans]|eukprot:XP_008873263.1 serine/threonine protein kinase [Aphanomyces invadans]
MEQYNVQRVLATALFGDVVLCEDRRTGDHVAIKRMHLAAAKDQKTLVDQKIVAENVDFEAQVNHTIHAAGGHPHVLRMRTEFVQHDYLHFVYDYCEGGDLLDKLAAATRFDRHTALTYFSDIVAAVHRLHEIGFAHRDLSLENVLLGGDNDCQLCDFGLACDAATIQTAVVGKKYYMAPEVVAGSNYDATKADVWSLGVLLFEMLSGGPLFNEAAPSDPRFLVLQSEGSTILFQDLVDTDIAHLLGDLLCLDPLKRPSMDTVLRHSVVVSARLSKRTPPSLISDCMAALATSNIVAYLNRVLFSPWQNPTAVSRAG